MPSRYETAIKNAIYSTLNFFDNEVVFGAKRISNNVEVSTLKNNRPLYKLHDGKRCFILGNGPSLKDVNFADLEDEYVFTVNQCARNREYVKLKSNFHFWVDESFFRIDENNPEDKELLQTMIDVNAGKNRPICFYPLSKVDFVKKYELDKTLDIRYLGIKLRKTDPISGEFRLDRYICSFSTVVQYCIASAIYMGFKEIYLLGCDSTGIINSVNAALAKMDDNYSYEVSNNERIRMTKMVQRNGFLAYCETYTSMIKSFSLLSDYCRRRSIKLINCSAQTVLDMIPRENIKEVLSRPKDGE